ncbi:unnamed protein product [Gemmata massiliana]|uniref:Uncharacterized protein n=1 Tax=Gemmata massiliana TaxID=1210884 RepID=A0A6P2D3C4_9BACT|nr:unnamed protein product [Gemmata massiliana]
MRCLFLILFFDTSHVISGRDNNHENRDEEAEEQDCLKDRLVLGFFASQFPVPFDPRIVEVAFVIMVTTEIRFAFRLVFDLDRCLARSHDFSAACGFAFGNILNLDRRRKRCGSGLRRNPSNARLGSQG